MEVVNLLKNQPKIFGTYDQFISDCANGQLPDYCFVEPNYSDHTGDGGGEALASDQHPDHDVQAGEVFIGTVYNAIRQNPDLWRSTALLIVYDEHGGIYDHVSPPPCTPDGYNANVKDTGGIPFAFDRLGVRVPAILVSPWIAKGTVVPGPGEANGRAFEHASIPGTVTDHFIGAYDQRTPREKAAPTFLDLLTDNMRPDSDCPTFNFD
jgi:phospholipase C